MSCFGKSQISSTSSYPTITNTSIATQGTTKCMEKQIENMYDEKV